MASPDPITALTQVVLTNLEYQHDWTSLQTHTHPSLPRPLLYGLPPKRLYVHPDEQVAIIKAENEKGEPIPQEPEVEWVLPLHLSEKWSPAQFAGVFDAIEAIPPGGVIRRRGKRILLATVQDDSTVTYYWIHDGLVKPRQN
ncbi:putative tRNA-splicing endonuclease subunit tsp-1 [Collariella sp. IMI 366227]|nr:putative tRNA-splicing endonuclease subunit tsp-1 [Collariella sp. IMI 366227]